LKRLSILIIQFYQLLLLYNIAFTLLAIFILVLETGRLDSGVFLFAKIMGFLSAIGLHYYSSKQSYFYFRNAGYRVITIFIGAFAVDTLIYILIAVLPSTIQHAAAYLKN